MACKNHAEKIVRLALEPIGGRIKARERGDRSRLAGFDLDANAAVVLGREEMGDNVETLLAGRIVDGGEIDETNEKLAWIVTQIGHRFNEPGRLDRHGQLAESRRYPANRTRQRLRYCLAELLQTAIHLTFSGLR